MNIFAEMIHSLYDFKSYKGFIKNGWLKVLLYGLLLTVANVLLTVALPAAAVLLPLGGAEKVIEEGIPDFTLESGRLHVEKPLEYKQYDQFQGGIYIKIDTSGTLVQDTSDVDLLAFDRVLLMDAGEMLVKNNGDLFRLSFTDLKIGDWDKEKLLQQVLPYVGVGMWIFVCMFAWFMLVGFFMEAVLLGAVGIGLSAMQRCRMPFGRLYRLAVYAQTPSVVFRAVYAWIPVAVPFFSVISFGITIFYMWKAIRQISSEMQGAEPGCLIK